MGITLLSDIDKALSCPQVDGQPQLTTHYLKALRLYVYAAAKYVCLAENRAVDFNEWQASEWLEEAGAGRILRALELFEKSDDDATDSDESGSDEDGPKTIQAYKFATMAKLQLLPDRYYDLTPAETAALTKGKNDQEVFALFNTRIVASLIRNAHFEKPIPAEKFLPLPIDKKIKKKDYGLPPELFIQMLNMMMPETTPSIKGQVVSHEEFQKADLFAINHE